MKNICFFISSINKTGGTERVCISIANKLSQLGYRVTILSMYGKEPFFKVDSKVSLIQVYQNKYPFKLFLPLVILTLRSKISKIKPDVLINVDTAMFIYSFVSALGLKLKNVVWEHFNFNSALNSKVRVIARRLAARYSNAIITLTQKDNNNWRHQLDCKAPLITIHNPSPFSNLSGYSQIKNLIVLSVGRLTYQKGFDRLLDVWEIVQNNNYLSWKLHIVGSGELKEQLKQKIEDLKLNNSVKLFPATDQIETHYQTASIYCMTSRFEGFPMVLLEAQSFGLPLVSFDCETGPSEIIKNNENGILVKNGDQEAMAKSLMLLIDTPEKRLATEKKAYENSLQYNIDIIIKSWINLFDTLQDHKKITSKL